MPQCPAETRTHDLLVANPTHYRNTTTPPLHPSTTCILETFHFWLPFSLSVIISSYFRFCEVANRHFCISLSMACCTFTGCSHFSVSASCQPVCGLYCHLQQPAWYLYLRHNTVSQVFDTVLNSVLWYHTTQQQQLYMGAILASVTLPVTCSVK